jgi:hypothetical protein
MCKSEKENKEAIDVEASGMEKNDLELSLILFPARDGRTPFFRDTAGFNIRYPDLAHIVVEKRIVKGDITYSVDIINDNLIATRKISSGVLEYKSRLTNHQYLEIKKKVSALDQKFDRLERYRPVGYGAALKVNGQVYYQDNWFRFDWRPDTCRPLPPPPEIRHLIEYILDIVRISPLPPSMTPRQREPDKF